MLLIIPSIDLIDSDQYRVIIFNPQYLMRRRSICKIKLNVNIRPQNILRFYLHILHTYFVLYNHADVSIKNLICKLNVARYYAG